MGGLTSFWQRIYFNIYRFFAFIGYFMWLPADRKRSVMAAIKGSREYGIMKMSVAAISVFSMFIFTSIANLILAMIGLRLLAYTKNVFAFMGFFVILPAIINYLLLWRKGKYLHYFREFDKEPASEKRKWAWISLAVLAGIILLFILSVEVSSEMYTG